MYMYVYIYIYIECNVNDAFQIGETPVAHQQAGAVASRPR